MPTQTRSQAKLTASEPTQPKATRAKTKKVEASQTKPDPTPTKARRAKADAPPSKAPTQPSPPAPVAFSITAPQSHLSTLLSTVAPAIQTNPTNPIFSYLKIEALDSACRLTATDPSYTITAQAPCDTLHPGVGLLPTQLAHVIQAIPASEHLALVGSTTKDTTQIALSNKSGVISTAPISLPVEGFQAAELRTPGRQYDLPTETLRLALQTALGSAGAKDKPILYAVHLTFNEDAMVCEATDGHHITLTTLAMPPRGRRRRQTTPESTPVDCCIPLDTVKALVKLLAQAPKESDVTLRLDTSTPPKAQFQIQTEHTHITLTCHGLADSYPNLQQVIERFTYGTSAWVNRIDLLRQAQVIKAMVAKSPVATLTLRDASLQLAMEGVELSGIQTVQATLAMPEPEFETALNLDLLINLARSIQGEQLLLEFGHSESLIKLSPVVSDVDGLGVVGYVMPVKVTKPTAP